MFKLLFQQLANGGNPYLPEKYWSRRNVVVSRKSKTPKFIKAVYLRYLRKSDAFNCAEIATGIGGGVEFAEPPILPHGLNGIVIHPKSRIEKNVTIMHQVTIGTLGTRGDNSAAVIGDNVFIGAGAKILGNIHIGNNVKIGANAVVLQDVPDIATAVGVPAKVIFKTNKLQKNIELTK